MTALARRRPAALARLSRRLRLAGVVLFAAGLAILFIITDRREP